MKYKTSAQQFMGTKKKRITGLNESIASFIALAENAPDIICRFDRDYFHLYVNPAIEKVTGMPTSHFIGKTTGEIGMAPEFAQFWNTHINLAFESKQQVTFEFDFPSSDGTKYFQSYVVPEYDEQGNVVTVLSISRDITAIKQSEKEKDELIAMVTHELKTPVTSVKAFAQLLNRDGRKVGKENSQYLAKMDSQLNHLNKLIGDLLDATRIGSGNLHFNESTFNFSELVREMVDDLKKTDTTHTYQVSKKLPYVVTADSDRIRQVLLNLLTNAAKYSPPETEIAVMLKKIDGFIQCCVKDNGPGIPKAKQSKLFQRFTRLTKENHTGSPGLGLGLFISSQIIKQSGGKIWVESDAGKGTTFCFTLPIAKQKS